MLRRERPRREFETPLPEVPWPIRREQPIPIPDLPDDPYAPDDPREPVPVPVRRRIKTPEREPIAVP